MRMLNQGRYTAGAVVVYVQARPCAMTKVEMLKMLSVRVEGESQSFDEFLMMSKI